MAVVAGEIGPLSLLLKAGVPLSAMAYLAVEVPKFNVPKLMHADVGNPGGLSYSRIQDSPL